MEPITSPDGHAFGKQLAEYKRRVDADIAIYAEHASASTQHHYGEHAAATSDAYLDLLKRGGKRVRGALVIVGYEMCGGQDPAMITRAATAIEMMHAYILIIDDIQDRADIRRGKPTVHKALADYHRKLGLRGDPEHTGVSLALCAALAGAHAASNLLVGLQADADLRLKVLSIVNRTMIVTAHGQTYDIMNELAKTVNPQDLARVLEWKTAEYSFLNPLCVGMVLAGALCETTDAIRGYGLNAGKAFQIGDDIMGIFGTDETTGKNTLSDIREGKRTLLTTHALEHASAVDKEFLEKMLGNAELTTLQFTRCQQIIQESGALVHAQQVLREYVDKAIMSLDSQKSHWQPAGVDFLRNLALYLAKM
jgi:geranylgeranyl diphosphate synthase type I